MDKPSAEDQGNVQAGAQVGSGASAAAEIQLDITPWRTLNEELKKTTDRIAALKRDIPTVAGAIGKIGGGDAKGFGSSRVVRDAVSAAMEQSTNMGEALAGARGAYLNAGGRGGGGIGAGIKAFGKGAMSGGPEAAIVAAAADKAIALAGTGIKMMDRRIDSAANYALSADRMSVLYQQMTGKSQVQVQNQFRQPLTNYRLGAGGINTLLGLQATTGINAAKQASSVEAIRTISGYSLGAGDAANMLASLGRPETVNRMFMMGGQALYGFGGKQNTGMSVIQNIVKGAGLTNKALVDSAFQQGSVSRDRLRQMGVPEDMIDTVLQYAKQNVTYREKGGKGMYDPSNKAQRKKMGIEDNFATQAEETERVRGRRDENFYSRQADNYAKMEKATQRVTKALGAFEDKLSGIIGARASTRPFQKAAGGIMKALGKAAMIGGILAAPATGGASLAIGSIGGGVLEGIGGVIGGGSGDAVEPNSGSTSPSSKPTSASSTATSGERSPEENEAYITSWYNRFKKQHLNPTLAQRVLSMVRDFPSLKIEGGVRTIAGQLDLWHENMKPASAQDIETANKKGKEYQALEYPEGSGNYWVMKNGGKNKVAAPGKSMHEIGLAVDFATYSGANKATKSIVAANAERYGLTLPSWEYWHVEMKEHAHSRKKFAKEDKGKVGEWGQKYNENVNGSNYFDVNNLITPNATGVGGVVGVTGSAGTVGGVRSGSAKATPESSLAAGSSSPMEIYSGLNISEVLKRRQKKLSRKISEGKYGAAVMTPATGSPGGGDAVYDHSTSRSAHISGSAGIGTGGSTMVRGGDTFHISPTIHIGDASNVNSGDIKRLAREVTKLLEQEVQTSAMRRK